MMRVPNHIEGERKFMGWVQSRPLSMPGCKTLDQCIVSKHARDLRDRLGDKWHGPVEALACMVAMVAMLNTRESRAEREPGTIESLDLVSAWGLSSRIKRESVDINESRLLKWARASDWDEFFEHCVTGVRVLKTYRQPFDVISIYRWIRFRADHPDDFAIAAAERFYMWQGMNQDGVVVDAVQHHAPERAPELIAQAIEMLGSQTEVARRCGVSRVYLQLLAKGEKSMSYTLQVALETIVSQK